MRFCSFFSKFNIFHFGSRLLLQLCEIMRITKATQDATLSLQLRKLSLAKSMIQPNTQLIEILDSVLISTTIAQAVKNLNLRRFVCLLLRDIVKKHCA